MRNAVILISEVDSNLAQGMANDAAIVAAAEHRARPICLTACAAILGMIPISSGILGPMAYAIIGGLLVATLVTLTVLPASFSLLLQWGLSAKPQKKGELRLNRSPADYTAVSAKRFLRIRGSHPPSAAAAKLRKRTHASPAEYHGTDWRAVS